MGFVPIFYTAPEIQFMQMKRRVRAYPRVNTCHYCIGKHLVEVSIRHGARPCFQDQALGMSLGLTTSEVLVRPSLRCQRQVNRISNTSEMLGCMYLLGLVSVCKKR